MSCTARDLGWTETLIARLGTPAMNAGATWAIVALATAGVILRPWRVPEAVWAVAGAAALVAAGLVPWPAALRAVGRGTDVYLFLAGMMLLSELARREGLFDTLAARRARGSAPRLFLLVYLVGTAVTALMSNDATAVVLTPAVFAVARAARADPLPYLYICAFIANAASFVLPISNPANLVVFGNAMPPLGAWIGQFAVPSLLSIGATFAVLRFSQRAALRAPVAVDVPVPALSRGGRIAAVGVGAMSIALLTASAVELSLGWTAALAGGATLLAVWLGAGRAPGPALRDVSWAVLPLVAGLFVLVEGLDRTGVLGALSGALREGAATHPALTAWVAGVAAALGCNLVNNLPAGLLAGAAVQAAAVPPVVAGAVLIGIDLGPNLSVTGSLATILWLVALRREGLDVGTLRFLRLGAVVMPPALLLALAALTLRGG